MPLSRDPLGRYLPWLVAFLVYIAAVALAGFFLVHDSASDWKNSVPAAVTVQMPAAGDDAADAVRVRAVLDVLEAAPGVERAEVVPEQAVRQSLSPWLDGTELGSPDRVPLPRLIEVETAADDPADLEALGESLRGIDPDITVDDHGRWLMSLLAVTDAVQALAAAVVAAIAVVTVGAVIVATLSGLGIHRDTIELLHLIGARDSAVAGEFANRAGRRALYGGAAGLLAAVASLAALGQLAAGLADAFLFESSLGPAQWAALAAIPFAIALISMMTTWITVIRFLSARY